MARRLRDGFEPCAIQRIGIIMSLFYYHLLFFFVAFGSKAVLAGVTIYLLLPADLRCAACDGETLLLRMGTMGRAVRGLLRGRVERRWCPRCGWEGTFRTRERALVTGGSGRSSVDSGNAGLLPPHRTR